MESVEWGEFKLEDILEWQSQIEIDPLKLEELKDTSEAIYPFYGQSTKNNGVISYNQLINEVLNNKDTKPTILIHSNNQNIVYLETPFYLKDGHGATSILQSKNLNKINQIFIISAIEKAIKHKYTYNKKATKIELKNTIIQLPIKNNEIDYEFMESFVKDLENDYVASLEMSKQQKISNYLSVSNLSDYNLTSKEQSILDDFINDSIKWDKFRLDELFEIFSSKKIFHANQIDKIYDECIENSFPYVVRTRKNNGIKGYIINNKDYANDENTLSFAQDTFSIFYQKEKYFTGNKIKVLRAKFQNKSEKIMHYLATSLQKSLQNFTWGTGSTVDTILSTIIQLPIKNNEIDYEFMESFVNIIQKLMIKDFNSSEEEKIKIAKELAK